MKKRKEFFTKIKNLKKISPFFTYKKKCPETREVTGTNSKKKIMVVVIELLSKKLKSTLKKKNFSCTILKKKNTCCSK